MYGMRLRKVLQRIWLLVVTMNAAMYLGGDGSRKTKFAQCVCVCVSAFEFTNRNSNKTLFVNNTRKSNNNSDPVAFKCSFKIYVISIRSSDTCAVVVFFRLVKIVVSFVEQQKTYSMHLEFLFFCLASIHFLL